MLALVTAGCIDDFDTVGDGQFGSSGPSCSSICERFQDCEGATDDCVEDCRELEDRARRTGCEGELDDLLSCLADTSDICDDGADACESELERFAECSSDDCFDCY
jgi:hypothetical protein